MNLNREKIEKYREIILQEDQVKTSSDLEIQKELLHRMIEEEFGVKKKKSLTIRLRLDFEDTLINHCINDLGLYASKEESVFMGVNADPKRVNRKWRIDIIQKKNKD